MKIIAVFPHGERLVCESVGRGVGKNIVRLLQREYGLNNFELVRDDYIMNEKKERSNLLSEIETMNNQEMKEVIDILFTKMTGLN